MWNQCSWKTAIFLFHFIGWVNKPRSKGRGGWEGWQDLGWKAAVRSLTISAGQKITLCVLNCRCELVRTICTTSEAIVHFLFLGFSFSVGFFQHSIWLQSYGSWHRNYLHDIPIKFYNSIQLKLMAQGGPSEPERRESQKWVFSMDLPTPVAGTEMSWRSILGQVEWKGRIKGKIVGVEINILDVTEETEKGEKKKGVKQGNKNLLNYELFHIYSIES